MSGVIALIAAVAENGVIGSRGRIPWDIPEDRAHFRKITMGATLVMGRRTYEEIGHPLPGRRTLLLSTKCRHEGEACRTLASFDAALDRVRELAETERVFICGGASVYQAFFPYVSRIYLTEVHREVEGDTYFPDWDRSRFCLAAREDREGFSFLEYAALQEE